ncbi:acyl-CoA dehydrogenase [Nocardioides sp.]|uniref:acyl-CoA dehydrogenase family protein n=1 Tax=Nocardioides sp. TaxID=35761 RepID=UPI00263964D9|nr:acyl-CoA dehydrogenase [Nocardioides sp.]
MGDESVPTDLTTALHQILAGPHADVRARVLEGLGPYASVLSEAEELGFEEFRERVREVVLELADSGLTVLGFPTEYGGGGDVGASIAAFETLAHGDLSVLVKVGVQFGLFGGAILQLGTQRHHDAYLDDLIHGRVLGCFAMTEHGHGSNVAAIGTVATYDPASEEFVLTTTAEDAYKDYIGNAAEHAELAVVFARLEIEGESQGVHAFVARIREHGPDGRAGRPVAGVRIADDGRKMGLNGVDNGRIWFDGLRIPRESLLNRFADVAADGTYASPIESVNRRFFTMLGTLIQGRVSVGGAAVTASKVALTIAIRYALQRRQFEGGEDGAETLLLDYGQHQRRLLPLLARSYALTFAQEVLVDQLHASFNAAPETESGDEAPEERRELESRAAGTKAVATWHATRTIQECREACGGSGYLAENRFAALKADTDVFTTFEGDNTVLIQLVAKGLLTNYSGEFSSMDQLDLVRFVAGQAVETVVEKTQVHKLLERVRDLLPSGEGAGREPDIRDADYHQAMLRFREEHMLAGVARRLKGGVDRGTPAGTVFSHVQDHVIALGHAHVDRLVHEAFADRVAGLEEGPVRDLLDLVADLHALSVIEADRAWWMEHGRLSVQRSKAITAEINRLCRELRPHARTLVDAFGIPEAFLSTGRAEDQ